MRPTCFISRLSLCLAALLSSPTALAQIVDDFSDSDLTRDPSWIGDVDRWRTGTLNGSQALQSFGASAADTIYLALETGWAFGRWSFTWAHQGINLSTFNGVRIFLAADASSPAGPISGYYLQIGTNNSDALSLWRVDGNLSERTELARSEEALVAGDSSHLRLILERDVSSRWSVKANGLPLFSVEDDHVVEGGYFIVWAKHTSAGAAAFYLDDLRIEPISAPEKPPDGSNAAPGYGDLVINEVQYNPLGGASEFIELYNRSTDTLDLSTVTIRDSRSPPMDVVEHTAIVAPGRYVVLAADAESFAAQFRRVDFIAPSRWATLNNGGDFVIVEAGNEVIDSTRYDGQSTPPGFSLERIDPDGPSLAFNFSASKDPFGATPGAQNSVYAPDTSGPALVFVEQRTPRMLDLHFDEPLMPGILTRQNVSAGASRPDSVKEHSGGIYSVFFSAPPTSRSIEVVSAVDRRGNRSGVLSQPISYTPAVGDLVVNEIMYEPLTDRYDGLPDQSEYVEFVNRSPRRLTLGGLYRTRQIDELGGADTLDISVPLMALEPDDIYVVTSDSSALSAHAVSHVEQKPRLSLLNGGDTFRLHHTSGVTLDEVSYDPSWHHPDLLIQRGTSLERIDVDGPSSDARNWSSSVDPFGGTPGRPNSVRLRRDLGAEDTKISAAPNPFSPDRDGYEDIVVITVRLPLETALVRARIFDVTGRLVRDLRTDLSGRESKFYWDGLDGEGRRLRVGVYVVLVEVFSERGRAVDAYKLPVVLARRL